MVFGSWVVLFCCSVDATARCGCIHTLRFFGTDCTPRAFPRCAQGTTPVCGLVRNDSVFCNAPFSLVQDDKLPWLTVDVWVCRNVLFLFSHHKETDEVGDHGHHVEGGGHVVTVVDIIDQPQDLGGDDHQLQGGGALGVQEPGEQGGGENGQPADEAVAHGSQGQHNLQRDEKQLQRGGAAAFYKDEIAQDGYHVGDKAAGSAQDQVAGPHKAALDALGDENVGFLFQQADGDHDQTANAGNDVADEKGVHR